MHRFTSSSLHSRAAIEALAGRVLEKARELASMDAASLDAAIQPAFEAALRESGHAADLESDAAESAAETLYGLRRDARFPDGRDVADAYFAETRSRAKARAARLLAASSRSDPSPLRDCLLALDAPAPGTEELDPAQEVIPTREQLLELVSKGSLNAIEQLPSVALECTGIESRTHAIRTYRRLHGAAWAVRYLESQRNGGGSHRRDRGHAIADAFDRIGEDYRSVAAAWLAASRSIESYRSPIQQAFVSFQRAIGVTEPDNCEGDTIPVGLRECLESARLRKLLDELDRTVDGAVQSDPEAIRCREIADCTRGAHEILVIAGRI